MQALFASLAIICAFAALVLVCIWAQDPSANEPYIGTPKWENDTFPSYHPVLMVSGFFLSQVLGICTWSLVPNHDVAKAIHGTFMMAAIGCMIAGLYAVVDFEQYVYMASLTSMHSWVGVMTITLFGIQVIFGMVMGAMKGMNSPMSQSFATMHRGFGIVTLGVTTVTIISGIQSLLISPVTGYNSGKGSCGYIASDENFDKNPAAYYSRMPDACQIGLGLGVLVVLSAIFTGMAVLMRNAALSQASTVDNVYQPGSANAAESNPRNGNYEIVNK